MFSLARIAQVTAYFYPLMLGGAEWYVYNISRKLVKMGHEVEVLTSNGYQGKNLTSCEEVDGVKILRLPLRFDLSYRLKLWQGLKEHLQEGHYDIIHTYDYAQAHSHTAIKVGESTKVPVAMTVFDVHSLVPRPFYKRLPMKLFDHFLARRTLGRASKVLVRAPNLLPPLHSMGVPFERMVVTPSGIIDRALEPFDGKAFLEKHSIDGNPIILYVGRLHPMKGPQYILMAAPKILAKYPDASFVFVGPDQNDYLKTLKMIHRKLRLDGKVFFVGPIYDFEEKMMAYASCDVFALPSGYEGTSQAIFEAMAQGKPIVATNRGGIPSQIRENEEGLLVDYGDFEDLADAILRILDDKELYQRFSVKAWKKAYSFTYPILVKQLDSIYHDLLDQDLR